MKSAKEIIAQYRLQGFSDELIELIAMDEEDQELAEALLDELICEQQEEQSESTASLEIDNADIGTTAADIIESENMIKSAYERSGISALENEEQDNAESAVADSTYIPPKLEVIEGGAAEYDQKIIPFTPEYALSEEEQEYALNRSLAFFGEIEHEDEISPLYPEISVTDMVTEEDWYIEEVEQADLSDLEVEEYAEVEIIEITPEAIEAASVAEIYEEFDCIDFDNIGRSSLKPEPTIEEDQEILDLDTSRPAEPEWRLNITSSSQELEEIREWAENVQGSIELNLAAKQKLETELLRKEESLIIQDREMEQLKKTHQSFIIQLEEDSARLASTQVKLNTMREESERSENMLLKFGDEIELLHSQLNTANSICSNLSRSLIEKDATILELSTAYSSEKQRAENNELTQEELLSRQRHAQSISTLTIRNLEREVCELRQQLESAANTRAAQSSEYMANSALLTSLRQELDNSLTAKETAEAQLSRLEHANAKQGRRIRRLEKIREKIKSLEFENNVFKTETIPNLQADKEDLVELASEEYNKAITLDEIALKRSRRLSYATTLAAVACLMLVLMPILSWNNLEAEKDSIKSEYSLQLAAAETNKVKLEEKLASMQNKLESVNNDFNVARESWNIQLSSLKAAAAQNAQPQPARIIQASRETSTAESQFNLVAYEDDMYSASTTPTGESFSQEQYNDIAGIEEYQQELAQADMASDSIEYFDGKQARVRRGEGLSQVLWRVYRRSNPEMVSYISKLNNLKQDRRGNPLLKIDQKLLLPKDVSTAMATSQPNKSRM